MLEQEEVIGLGPMFLIALAVTGQSQPNDYKEVYLFDAAKIKLSMV
jgi:hypothetical protein